MSFVLENIFLSPPEVILDKSILVSLEPEKASLGILLTAVKNLNSLKVLIFVELNVVPMG